MLFELLRKLGTADKAACPPMSPVKTKKSIFLRAVYTVAVIPAGPAPIIIKSYILFVGY